MDRIKTLAPPHSAYHARAEFYMGEILKLHKSVLEHLKARGVLIDDECKAELFLSNVNY